MLRKKIGAGYYTSKLTSTSTQSGRISSSALPLLSAVSSFSSSYSSSSSTLSSSSSSSSSSSFPNTSSFGGASSSSSSTSSSVSFSGNANGEGYINRATGRRELHGGHGSLRVRKDSLEWAIGGFLEPTQSPAQSREQLDKAVTCLEEAVEEGVFPSLIAISILLRRTTRETDASFASRVISAADVAGMSLDGRQLGWAISGAATNRDHAAFHSLLRKVSEFPGPVPSSILTRTIAGYFSLGQKTRALQQLDKAREAGINIAGMLPAIIDETLRSFPREPPTQRLFTALEGCESRFEAVMSRQLRSGLSLSAIASNQNSIRLATELVQARDAVILRRKQMQKAATTSVNALESLIFHYATSAPNITTSEIDSLLSLLTGSLSPEGGVSHHQSFGPGSVAAYNSINNNNSNVGISSDGPNSATTQQTQRMFFSLAPHALQPQGLQMWLAPSSFRELNDEAPTRRQLLTLLSQALSSERIVSTASPRALSRCLAFILQNFKPTATFALGASPFDDAVAELDGNSSSSGPVQRLTLNEIAKGTNKLRSECTCDQIWSLEDLSPEAISLNPNEKSFGFANLNETSFKIAWIPETGLTVSEISARYLSLIAGLYEVLARIDASSSPPPSSHHILLPWAAHERVLTVLLSKNRVVAAAQVAGHIAQSRGIQNIQSAEPISSPILTILQSHSAIADPFLVERLVAATRTVFATTAKTNDDLLYIDSTMSLLLQRILRPELVQPFLEVASNTTQAHLDAAVIVGSKTGIRPSVSPQTSVMSATKGEEGISTSTIKNPNSVVGEIKFIWPQEDQVAQSQGSTLPSQLRPTGSVPLGDSALTVSMMSQSIRASLLRLSNGSSLTNTALTDILQSIHLSREAILATHSRFGVPLNATIASNVRYSNDESSSIDETSDVPQVLTDALYNKISSTRSPSIIQHQLQSVPSTTSTSPQAPLSVSTSLGVAPASSASLLLLNPQQRQLKDAIIIRSLAFASRLDLQLKRNSSYIEWLKKVTNQ